MTDAVEITTLIAARPETIFRFFTDPARFSQWVEAAVELTDGQLSIQFDRFATRVVGEVIESVPPRRIAFTWGVAEGPQQDSLPPGSTTVSIDLEPAGDGRTRVVLRHSGLPTEQERKDHAMGWRHYASQLERRALEAELGRDLEKRVDTFLGCWSETDRPTRQRQLESCFAADGRFTDAYADLAGLDALLAHVGGVIQMFPGVSLRRTGPIVQCREHASYPWDVTGPGDTPLGQGHHYVGLAPDGKMTRVVGFWTPPEG